MPELRELQSWFQTYVTADKRDYPALSQSSHSPDDIDRNLKANDRMTAEQRIGIYAGMYKARLHSVLVKDFPGMKGVLGEKKFSTLAAQFFKDAPPRHFDLNKLSLDFYRYVQAQNNLRPKRLIADLIAYETTLIEFYVGADPLPLTQSYNEDNFLSAVVRFNACVALCKTRFPLKELHRQPTDAKALLKSDDKHWRYYLIYRPTLGVRVDLISFAEYMVLCSLKAGKTIEASVIEALRKDPTLNEEILSEKLGSWFQGWTQNNLLADIRA